MCKVWIFGPSTKQSNVKFFFLDTFLRTTHTLTDKRNELFWNIYTSYQRNTHTKKEKRKFLRHILHHYTIFEQHHFLWNFFSIKKWRQPKYFLNILHPKALEYIAYIYTSYIQNETQIFEIFFFLQKQLTKKWNIL